MTANTEHESPQQVSTADHNARKCWYTKTLIQRQTHHKGFTTDAKQYKTGLHTLYDACTNSLMD